MERRKPLVCGLLRNQWKREGSGRQTREDIAFNQNFKFCEDFLVPSLPGVARGDSYRR